MLILTARRLHSSAHGGPRGKPGLGTRCPSTFYAEGVGQRTASRRVLVQRLRRRKTMGWLPTQGALAALATLGCGVQRLRRKTSRTITHGHLASPREAAWPFLAQAHE